jgi:hypothetical protein
VTPRWKYLVISGLILAVVGAAIYFPILRRRVKRAARLQQQSEEQARRELAQPIVANPGDPRVKAKLFWASDAMDSTLVPVAVELPLANDPVLRSKQVLNTLLAGPVDAELRTLPPDAVLLANVPQVRRLKILIHGQEVDTLAGHVDLTGAFVVNSKTAQPEARPSVATPSANKAPAAPATLTPEKAPGKLAQPERKP